jgi:monoamine oxidase
MEHEFDIIIIGAGIAGLMAARELCEKGKKVCVVEASERVGGRINTITKHGFSQPIEEGAEFIHGDLPLTLQLLKETGVAYTDIDGKIFQHKDGRILEQEDFVFGDEKLVGAISKLGLDMPVYDFLQQHFGGEQYAAIRQSVTGFIEGYEAADTTDASVLAIKHDLELGDESQYRINRGYSSLVNHLHAQCLEQGCSFHFSERAKEVLWEAGSVHLKTSTGSHTASKLLVTAPIGILREEPNSDAAIKFDPFPAGKFTAIKQHGCGLVIKIFLEFDSAFWQMPETQQRINADLGEMMFLLSNQEIPTWWTQFPLKSNLLTGWLGGPRAKDLKSLPDEAILEKAIQSLATIFMYAPHELKTQLKAWHVANWQNYPYTKCAYSYTTVDSSMAVQELSTPEKGTIFFAGEAIYSGSATGTVEAALASAVNVVKEILNS